MAQQLQFEKPAKKTSSPDTFRGFISKIKCNPVTGEKIIVAKDTSYHYQQSDDSYVLLLPLAVKGLYLYVQSYVDSRSELTERCVKIAKITDLRMSGNNNVHSFDGSARREDARLNKGVRFMPFLDDYFDPEKNKILYKTIRNTRLVVEKRVKYDSDKPEYFDKSGYVEIQHNRIPHEGKMHNFLQILACRTYKGEKLPAKVSCILSDEFAYVHEYLKFAVKFYKLSDSSVMDEVGKKHLEAARKDVLVAIDKFEKGRKDLESGKKAETIDIDDVVPSNKRKRGNSSTSTSKKSRHAAKSKSAAVVSLSDDDDNDNNSSDIAVGDAEVLMIDDTVEGLSEIERDVLMAAGKKKKRSDNDGDVDFVSEDVDVDNNVSDEEEYTQSQAVYSE